MLERLPVELLSHIVTYVTHAQTLANLSATCHALHDFTQKEGWKVFNRTRFPSLPVSGHWRDAAHALTTLSRNWDRKAFITSYVDPSEAVAGIPAERPGRRAPRGQTMGYQPAIDSYDECLGAHWSDRREVLAWSTGAGVVLRVSPGRSSSGSQNGLHEDHENQSLRPGVKWRSYRPPGSVDGRDDVTAVNLLRPYQKKSDHEDLLFGTANGDISLVSIPPAGTPTGPTVLTRFVTNGRTVRCADLSSAPSPLYAACLGDSNVVLYPLTGQPKSAPIDEVDLSSTQEHGCRVWSVHFTSPDRIAVGLGPATEPVQVFQATPSHLTKTPLRKFSVGNERWRVALNGNAALDRPTMSVYPIRQLPATSQAGHANGDVFLSGGYDGIIRLHDMRSNKDFECTYFDNTFDMPIYSLGILGRERLVAGRARHNLLTFWDLRVAGGRNYHYQSLDSPVSLPQGSELNSNKSASEIRSEWALYLTPRNTDKGALRLGRVRESPVYSISSPSPSSPFVYGGVENMVLELNFTSATDPWPDTIFPRVSPRKLPRSLDILGNTSRMENIPRVWDPHNTTLNLAMYDRGVLYLQNLVRQTTLQSDRNDIDSRWRKR